MSLLRRRKAEAEGSRPQNEEAADQPAEAEPRRPSTSDSALADLAVRMDEAMARVDRLESRLADLADAIANAPSHSDVLEVRLHSAKLAAELARATVELRGEIGMASDEARRAARLARSTDYETGEVPVTLPVDVDLSEIKPIDEKPKSKKRRSA